MKYINSNIAAFEYETNNLLEGGPTKTY